MIIVKCFVFLVMVAGLYYLERSQVRMWIKEYLEEVKEGETDE